jgi:hypothetical protein
MRALTLRAAAVDARAFAGRPRAIAFPSLQFGPAVPSALLEGDALYPATIDYHDARIGATFIAGHLLPARMFDYSQQARSRFDRALQQLPVTTMPRVVASRVLAGRIEITIAASRAMPFALAIWSDASRLEITGRRAIPAGRAGVVVPVDVRRGLQTIVLRCGGCSTSILPYAT